MKHELYVCEECKKELNTKDLKENATTWLEVKTELIMTTRETNEYCSPIIRSQFNNIVGHYCSYPCLVNKITREQ